MNVMQSQTVGHIEIFWDGLRLAMRWKRVSVFRWFLLIYAAALGLLAALGWLYGDLRHSFPKLPAFSLPTRDYVVSTGILWLGLLNLLTERVTFDPLTKHLQHKVWMEGEEGTLGWTEVRPNGAKHWAVALIHADGQKTWKTTGFLKAFRNPSQAQEVVDILNAYLHAPAVTETPGVWPPPPRVPSAPS